MFQVKVDDLRKSLSNLNGDDYIIIKTNQIILPAESKEILKPVSFIDMARNVQKFAEKAAEVAGIEVKTEEKKENMFEGLF